MQVGSATISVGAGTAILTLPDVTSLVTRGVNAGIIPFINGFKSSEDFGDELGWNFNASIAVPMGAAKTVSLKGFWANIEDDDSFTCTPLAGENCLWFTLVDDPAVGGQNNGLAFGEILTSNTKRDVDQWGVSLELKRQLNPGYMGITQAPPRRYFTLGADIRGIDQDLDVDLTTTRGGGAFSATYTEDLDTRYFGAYAAWGGDYSPVLFSGLWSRLGLQSSFLLRGGVYHADTDYSGRLIDLPFGNATSTLSLSRNDIAFIGGLKLETRKRIGRRATLSLTSEYEYYSYVPDMSYNTVDLPGLILTPGRTVGTSIGSDDAFSARTSLRLTIKLGPDSVFEEPMK